MNKLKYILGIAMASVIGSCTDFVEPAIPYKGFDTGVFLRTISATASIPYNQATLAASSFALVMEAVDAENGGTASTVDIFVSRRRGATVLPEVKVTTVQKEAFAGTSESKYLRASVSITMAQAMTALGLTTAALEGGDFVEFRLQLTDTQGRIFTNTTISSDIAGGVFYRSPFFYRVALVCATSIQKPEGTWSFTMRDNYGDGWQNGFISVRLGTTEVDQIRIPNGGGAGPVVDTYTFPVGDTRVLSFHWSADLYPSECEFDIVSPSGNLVASFVGAPAVGPINLNLCKE